MHKPYDQERTGGGEDFRTRVYVNKRVSLKTATPEQDTRSRTARERNGHTQVNSIYAVVVLMVGR